MLAFGGFALGYWAISPYGLFSSDKFLGYALIFLSIAFAYLSFRKDKLAGKGRAGTLLAVSLLAVFVLLAWVQWMNRPLYVVYEYDRYRVVYASDVESTTESNVPASRSVGGAEMLSLRPFANADEQYQLLLSAVATGVSLSARPELWQTYEKAKDSILQEAGKWSSSKEIQDFLAKSDQKGATEQKRRYFLPVIGKKEFWTAEIDPVNLNIVAFYPVDPYGE